MAVPSKPAPGKPGGLLSKLKNESKKAIEEHKGDATNFGQVDLPDGIRNGIAKLKDCRFGIYKEGDHKGEYFFIAAGTVMSPKTVVSEDGVTVIPIYGLRTQIGPEPICDTPKSMGKKKTQADHVLWVVNELKKLGADGEALSHENLEDTAKALMEMDPPIEFRFRTWKGKPTKDYPDPRITHEWNGATGNSTEVEAGEGLVETSGAQGEETGSDSNPDGAADDAVADTGTPDADTAAPELTDEEPDIDALVATASGDDDAASDAQAELKALAESQGYTEEEITSEEVSWEDVGNMARTPKEEEVAEEPFVPKKGGKYKMELEVFDKAKKKKVKKPVEVEVTSVTVKGELVNLKRLDNNTPMTKVAWSDLIVE